MAVGKNMILGILAIILGLLIIAFPYISIFFVSIIAGVGILFLGIWFLVQGFRLWGSSKAASIAYIILGLIALIAGIGLIGNIMALSFLASFVIYLTGFFLLISGILTLFTGEGSAGKGIGGVGVILGILYIILGMLAWNPQFLAIIIGVWLIFDGIALFFISPAELAGAPESE